jgi:hypothetical protein
MTWDPIEVPRKEIRVDPEVLTTALPSNHGGNR